MQYTITDKIKCFFICLFLLTTSYCVWDLTQFTKAKINESISIVENTKTQSLNEITAIRSDVFSYLYATNKQLDTRLNVIQKQTFSQIDSLQTSVLQRLDTTNNTISKVADNYSTIPTTINKFTNRFDAQTNCDINELCWQNLTTDLMIDTRNVVRDGATTFRLIDDNIPQLTKNTTDISGDRKSTRLNSSHT